MEGPGPAGTAVSRVSPSDGAYQVSLDSEQKLWGAECLQTLIRPCMAPRRWQLSPACGRRNSRGSEMEACQARSHSQLDLHSTKAK